MNDKTATVSLSLSLCKWLSQIAGQCSAHPEPEPSPVIIILSIGELLSVRAPGPQTTLRVERRQNDSQTVAFTPNLPSRWENVSVWKCEVPTVPLYFSSEWLYYLLHQCRGNRGDEVQVLRGIHHLLHILRYRWVSEWVFIQFTSSGFVWTFLGSNEFFRNQKKAKQKCLHSKSGLEKLPPKPFMDLSEVN